MKNVPCQRGKERWNRDGINRTACLLLPPEGVWRLRLGWRLSTGSGDGSGRLVSTNALLRALCRDSGVSGAALSAERTQPAACPPPGCCCSGSSGRCTENPITGRNKVTTHLNQPSDWGQGSKAECSRESEPSAKKSYCKGKTSNLEMRNLKY